MRKQILGLLGWLAANFAAAALGGFAAARTGDFYRALVRPLAAALLLPCLAWVTFAATLLWAIRKRHPGLLG